MNYSKPPWIYEFKKNCDWTFWSKDGYSIMSIPHDTVYGREEEDENNAKIIVLAPDMYELLVDLDVILSTALHNGHHDLIQRVKEVIRKANT